MISFFEVLRDFKGFLRIRKGFLKILMDYQNFLIVLTDLFDNPPEDSVKDSEGFSRYPKGSKGLHSVSKGLPSDVLKPLKDLSHDSKGFPGVSK